MTERSTARAETTANTDPDLATLRDLAVDIAEEAAHLLNSGLHDERLLVDTKSTDTDMVTEMDRAAETLIVERLQAARPADAIVGEEGADHPGAAGSRVRWVVDPLDGTTNYLYRLPGWAVSIGAEIDGEPAVGVVAVPSMNDVFTAATGLGATRNGERLAIGDPVGIHHALVGTGFGYDPAVRAVQCRQLSTLLPRVRDVRRFGAAAADLCHLAAGRLDAYFESGLAEWDRCAGSVIAREAGYRVETTDDHPHPGSLTIATHPQMWSDVCELLVDSGILAGLPD